MAILMSFTYLVKQGVSLISFVVSRSCLPAHDLVRYVLLYMHSSHADAAAVFDDSISLEAHPSGLCGLSGD